MVGPHMGPAPGVGMLCPPRERMGEAGRPFLDLPGAQGLGPGARDPHTGCPPHVGPPPYGSGGEGENFLNLVFGLFRASDYGLRARGHVG